MKKINYYWYRIFYQIYHHENPSVEKKVFQDTSIRSAMEKAENYLKELSKKTKLLLLAELPGDPSKEELELFSIAKGKGKNDKENKTD